MLLQPGQTAPIVRQLGFPGDASTYYVQAVIRKSSTGVIVKTVNLTDQGGQRFTGSFSVPGDVSGLGYYLDITSTVYTDSAYTTLSDIYQITNEPYYVRNLVPNNGGGGSYGGDYTDYKKIEEMIKRYIESIEIPKIPTYKEVDLSPVAELRASVEAKMDTLHTEIGKVEGKVAETGDELSVLINSKPNFQETNLDPLSEKIDDLKSHINGLLSDESADENVINTVVKAVEKSTEEVIEAFAKSDGVEEKTRGLDEMAAEMIEKLQSIRENKKVETKKEEKEPEDEGIDYLELAKKVTS